MTTATNHRANLTIHRGSPLPLGAHWCGEQLNFSLAVSDAEAVTLCLFTDKESTPAWELPLDPKTQRTGHIWHIALLTPPKNLRYAYRVRKQTPSPLGNGSAPDQLLLDPYARCVASRRLWHAETEPDTSTDLQPYSPTARIPHPVPFEWGDDRPLRRPRSELIVYEMHVRGFTKHSSSGVHHPGTFLGIIEKIDHLKNLGVNAVELLPVWEFNEAEYDCCALSAHRQLCQYWGYSPVSFFALMNRYASSDQPAAVIEEFKTMVKVLHQAGIQVLLDVVYNHTAEGGFLGPTYSFKGVDPEIYYMTGGTGGYLDFTGCGNTINSNHPQVIDLILDSLRYWVQEMHVDGFRFDLASILCRGDRGHIMHPAPLVRAITSDPLLAGSILIAEPWDAAGLYQVGSFYHAGAAWSEWNGHYRDSIRRFIKGMPGTAGTVATRFCGSEDLYGATGSPLSSVNFITAHDGFSLHDLVSYNQKHNEDNGEDNRDGMNENESWNCGFEGPTTDRAILRLRDRQMRNFHLALMCSRGIPMILMGDEYGHTKNGNNNSWCQDGETNWFLWDELERSQGFYRFFRGLIHFRKQHAVVRQPHFVGSKEVIWHGLTPKHPDWSPNSRLIAYQLIEHETKRDLFIAFNASSHAVTLTLPETPHATHWHWVVYTANPSPNDYYEEPPVVGTTSVRMQNHSAIVLKALPA